MKYITLLFIVLISGCAVLSYPAKHKSRDQLRKQFPDAIELTIGQIKHGHVDIGMTTEMVREAKGKPFGISYMQGSYGIYEQWQYGGYVNATYLYFENGILTTIQR